MAIPPASNAPPLPPPPPGQPANTGTILQLPASLSTAQTGLLLNGVVTEQLSKAQVLIQTNNGTLILRTSLPLPLNTAIALRVTANGPRPTVAIVRQGQTAPLAATAAVTAAPRATPASPAEGPSGRVGTIVDATVLRGDGAVNIGAIAAPANRGLVSNLSPGSRLSVRILTISTPGAATPASAAGITGTNAAGTPTGAPSSAAGPTLAATVTGANAAGQTIILSGGIELALATSRPLPVGGNLLLEILPFSPLADGLDLQSLALARRWETLHEALRIGGISSLHTMLTRSIPQAGVQLAGTLLFFLAALRAGDLRGWLGQDATRLLESGGMLERLGEEFGVMQRLATEPAGQDWRLFLVPFLSDEQLYQMRFFVRNDSGGTEDSASTGIRFIIEVTFTKLGPFQFDGLVRDKALDLIIRTELALPETVQRDITQIYADTLAALGYTGGIAIRTESFFDVQPLQEAGLPGKPGVVV